MTNSTYTPAEIDAIRAAVAKPRGRPVIDRDPILALLRAGLGPAHVARHLGIHVATVGRVKREMIEGQPVP